MPPPIHKITKLRKSRQKYSNLRAKVILQIRDIDSSKITNRERINSMNEAGKGLLDDADWDYFGEKADNTKSCSNDEPSASASDEVEPVATTTTAHASVMVEIGEPENQKRSVNRYGKYAEVDRESSLDEVEDGKGAENERESLGASMELSELLALERDNPVDFCPPNLEFPYFECSSETTTANLPSTLSSVNSHGWNESREKLPATLGTETVLPSIEEDGYDDDYDFENNEEEFPTDKFVKNQAFITKAEYGLRKLPPYNKYRVRRSSLLRICYTVIAWG